MHIVVAFAIVVFFVSGFYKFEKPPEDNVDISTGPSSQRVSVKHQIRPLSEFENENIVKQSYDYSCGSASLVMLLNSYLGENFNETQVINGLLRYGDTEKIIKRRAFSLLDMKRFAGVLGYKGVGYKAEIDDLKTLDRPCIVPIEIFGYSHFVVFKDIYKDHVFLADPAQGNISFTILKFKEMWFGKIAFVVYPKGDEDEIHAFQLTDADLRIIEADMERHMSSFDALRPGVSPEQRMLEDTGSYHIYRSK